jgi:hypothetical protein
MRRLLILASALCAAAGTAMAQPAGAPPGQGMPPGAQVNGADQLVGLFGATCLHFAGDTAGLRQFLTQQGAQPMPAQARDAFLAGRPGQVYDVSVPNVNLALVSLDDGGCEAVVEKANPNEVISQLQQQAIEARTPLTPLGTQGEKAANGVQHFAYSVTANGRAMHILASTAPAPPQAVITLAPK